ncbi:MAG TPA: hypothetical protein DDW41_04765 [Candidatus Andersenbacteria bacterium]|nr:hypothetical protein [Candidatus Andersenbacteria bacterium]
MTTPAANGTVLFPAMSSGGPSFRFAWDKGAGVSEYSFEVGTTPNAGDIYYKRWVGVPPPEAFLENVYSVPWDGNPVYVRLGSRVPNGPWLYSDYTYGTVAAARMISPTPGQAFSSPNVTFSWNACNNCTSYALIVYDQLGGVLYSKSTAATSVLVPKNLPVDSTRPNRVTLISMVGGKQINRVYKYYRSTSCADPRGFAVSGVSSTQIQLGWDYNINHINPVDYEIYRNGLLIGHTAALAYRDSGLTPNAQYNYKIRARDASGNYSGFSPTVYVYASTDTQPPSVPENFRTTGVTRTSVSLAWNASVDPESQVAYRIYRDGVALLSALATSYTDSGLTPGRAYRYEVEAYDSAPTHNTSARAVLAAPGTVTTLP